jgi:hypothetical protein
MMFVFLVTLVPKPSKSNGVVENGHTTSKVEVPASATHDSHVTASGEETATPTKKGLIAAEGNLS